VVDTYLRTLSAATYLGILTVPALVPLPDPAAATEPTAGVAAFAAVGAASVRAGELPLHAASARVRNRAKAVPLAASREGDLLSMFIIKLLSQDAMVALRFPGLAPA
jgi:hydroxymethylglutaryl-CoA reductase